MPSNIPGWLALILAPGGAAFVWYLAKAIDLIRHGAQVSEARAIKNLERFAEREATRADRLADLVDYWRLYAADCVYAIATHPELGPDSVPKRRTEPPQPPRRIDNVELSSTRKIRVKKTADGGK